MSTTTIPQVKGWQPPKAFEANGNVIPGRQVDMGWTFPGDQVKLHVQHQEYVTDSKRLMTMMRADTGQVFVQRDYVQVQGPHMTYPSTVLHVSVESGPKGTTQLAFHDQSGDDKHRKAQGDPVYTLSLGKLPEDTLKILKFAIGRAPIAGVSTLRAAKRDEDLDQATADSMTLQGHAFVSADGQPPALKMISLTTPFDGVSSHQQDIVFQDGATELTSS
ncbi:MAG TPA: hypothetical protein VGO93_02815 [Candidatus Xenobia bacterium]|jgi:hypothetical protein